MIRSLKNVKQWKKVKGTSQPKKGPKSPEFIKRDDSNDEEEEQPEKGQVVEKKLKRLHSMKKDQSHLNLLKQMTQVMKKKKSLKEHQSQTMKKKAATKTSQSKKTKNPRAY